MLIRHAEKQGSKTPPLGTTEDGVEDKHSLIVRGWQRAGALVQFFTSLNVAKGIEAPAIIYASAFGKTELLVEGEDVSKSMRPQQTVTPLARKLSLTMNTEFPVGEELLLVSDIKSRDGAVLVAWEHKHLPLIAREFSADAPVIWPAIDSIWSGSSIAGATGATASRRSTNRFSMETLRQYRERLRSVLAFAR